MTGATGVLGQDLVKELLHTTDSEIAILARREEPCFSLGSSEEVLTAIGIHSHLGSRIHVIEGT